MGEFVEFGRASCGCARCNCILFGLRVDWVRGPFFVPVPGVILRRLAEEGGNEMPAGGEGRNSIDGLRRRVAAFLGVCVVLGGRFDTFGPGDSGGERLSVVLLLMLLVSENDRSFDDDEEKDRGREWVWDEDGDAGVEIISVRRDMAGTDIERPRSPRTIAFSASITSPAVAPDIEGGDVDGASSAISAAPHPSSRCFAFLWCLLHPCDL